MKVNEKQCKITLEQLSRYRELSAVERSCVDLHLRRCENCKNAADGLAFIEQFEVPTVEFSKEKQAAIYDRLVPSVHEIAQKYTHESKVVPFKKPLLVGSSILAAAAALIFTVVSFYNQPKIKTITNQPKPVVVSDNLVEKIIDETINDGKIDRLQGEVFIDGAPYKKLDGAFNLNKETSVAVTSDSKINFRMGRFVKVALVDETSFSVNEISDTLISLNLERGKLAIEYDGSLGRLLEVHTTESIVRVKGTVFTVEVFGDGATQVGVTRGVVEVVSRMSMGNGVDVTAGNLLQVPGTGRLVSLGDRQRILAAEVEALEDNIVTSSNRIVRFDGSQEHVMVEIEDQVVGYTPLLVRIPKGSVNYRLSKPGMKVVEGQLDGLDVNKEIAFTMSPSEDYIPKVAFTSKRVGKKRASLNSAKVEGEESKNFVVRAKAAMTAGDLPYAARLLEETTRRVKGEQLVTALSLLAECYSAMGQYQQAADTFDRVAAIVPGTAIAQNSKYEVGRLAMDYIGDYDRARAAFTAYIATPSVGQLQEDAYFSLCELYGREGVRKNALHCFNDFLRTFPSGHRNAYAHLWRGVLHQEVDQRWRSAEYDLKAFIDAKPKHPRCEEARYRIALGRYNLGDYKGAMQMFDEYAKEHPDGQYLIRIERIKRAILSKPVKKRTSK